MEDDMLNPVLIFAEWNEPHSAALTWALKENRVPVKVAPHINELGSRFSTRVGDSGMSFSMAAADLTEFRARSVWFRRPTDPEINDCLEADRQFVQRQWTYFQKNIFHLCESAIPALWINRPSSAIAAESKLLQLKTAQALGMTIPELAITNDVGDVRRLVKKHGRIVFKTFYPHSWRSASSGNIFDIGVAIVDSSTYLSDESIAMCPGIFQRYIEKACDIRVTVLGHHIFAVQILKHSGEAYLDWRQRALDPETKMSVVRLSREWEEKIKSLMKQLDIVIGCVDLVVDRDGNLFFLEINQGGQFLFVEEKLPEVPLLRAMTAMLSTGRCDYSLTESAELGFADYQASDMYQEVLTSYEDSPLIVSMEE